MFENLFTNVRNYSTKLSENLFKENRHKSAENGNLKAENQNLNPSTSKSNSHNLNIKWPVNCDNKMQWLSSVPQDEEREDLISRFNSISFCHPEEKRWHDREEIRRRLAMGPDNDDSYCGERVGRKPSLQSRLQGGMNLQICFMNDPGSDSESSSPDPEPSPPPSYEPESSSPLQLDRPAGPRPSTARLTLPLKSNEDLFACRARLQAEARQALSQAKQMARMQMEVEKQQMPLSPITQMVRASLLKVGVPFPEERRRLSRQMLTEMNVAQLQVIMNDLHSQIELLNESLVRMLMARDELHMEQDSMLVDIEDLTRYLVGKEMKRETGQSSNCEPSLQRTLGVA